MTGSGGLYQQVIDFDGTPSSFAGDSSGAKPAAPLLKVQTVVGGAQPVLDPAYPSSAYYLKDAALASGATVSNSHVVVSGTAAPGSTVTLKDGANAIATVGVDDDGRWAVDVKSLNNGSHDLTAVVTNVYGVASAASAVFKVIINAALTGTAGADDENYWIVRGANGNAQNLSGLAGDDTLNGGGGNDTLAGGAGNDIYIVNNAGVTITEAANSGTDTVRTAVDLTLALNVENGVVSTAQGKALTGNAQNNILIGNAGADTLNGGAGADTLQGGDGDDRYTVDSVTDVVDEGVNAGKDTVQVAYATAATFTLGEQIENAVVTGTAVIHLQGNDANNELTGNATANLLFGGLGDDTLNGMAGNDTMTGGAGGDTYVVDALGDVVTELVDDGIDTVNTALGTLTLAANVENLVYIGSGAFNGTGNGEANLITGGAGADTLSGGAGNDTLVGGKGGDLLLGGDGVDLLAPTGGVGGPDVVDGGDGNDSVALLGAFSGFTRLRVNDTDIRLSNATTGETVTIRNVEQVHFGMETYALADLLDNSASANADTIVGTAGDDVLDGGAGADLLTGYQGDDLYRIDNKDDVIEELPDEGIDTVEVNFAAGTYTLGATLENATVTTAAGVAVHLAGNGLNNVLTGNAAANTLTGNAGNDTLIGGAGNDTMVGGVGDDEYWVAEAGDVVTEAPGGGIDKVRTGLATYTLAVNVEKLEYSGSGTFAATGNELNNEIIGGAGADTLKGGIGNDALVGAGGNDVLDGGAGSDMLVGGVGNDTLDGGAITDKIRYTDSNTVNYQGAAGGVNVSLASGTALDGSGGTDKLSNFNMVIGSAFNDTLAGSGSGSAAAVFEQFEGGDGDDFINGGLIDALNQDTNNRVSFQNAGSGVLVDLDEGTASGAATGDDTLVNINQVRGSAHNDELYGSDSTLVEQFEGMGGDDQIDGRGGFDIVRYDSASTGVVVNLADGTAIDGHGGTDTLTGIEGVRGSAHDDELIGGNPDNGESLDDGGVESFLGNAGDDLIDGGDGYDRAEYTTSTSAVVVDLEEGTAQDGFGDEDALLNIEGVRGSAFNDTLLGSDVEFYESFEGREGNDSIDGRGGIDRVDYDFAKAAVKVDLAAGTATDGYGFTDKLLNIEDARGSSFNDTLSGNAESNFLEGLGGNDTLNGGDGGDALSGGAGNDSLAGGAGDDLLNAGTGVDVADGGAGLEDVLELAGDYASYTITRPTATDVMLVNLDTGESITARNIEVFSFNDEFLSLEQVIFNQYSEFADEREGTPDDDTINGGGGIDTMAGLEGNDTYIVDVAGDEVIEAPDEGHDLVNVNFKAAGTYVLGDEIEDGTVVSAGTLAVGITGNELNNALTGNGGANKLSGLDGDDQLDGRAGNDTMIGGMGDDLYVVDSAGDVVTEAEDEGIDSVVTIFKTHILAKHVENLYYEGEDNFSGTGNELSNEMSAGNKNDTLSGGAGDDTLKGGTGNDSLLGGEGYDEIDVGTHTGAGLDFADGGLDDDVLLLDGAFEDFVRERISLTDTKLVNTITHEAVVIRNIEEVHFGDDIRTLDEVNQNLASTGNDDLVGTEDDDTINGGAGVDTMAGGEGSDTYVVDVSTDQVNEELDQGIDLVQVAFKAAGGTYVLTDNVENATVTGTVAANITGNMLDNVLTGNGVANKLSGDEGDDTLIGGAGNDTLIGGAGDDVYVVDAAGDVLTEAVEGGIDLVETALATYTLTAANVENLTFKGAETASFKATGNALANEITGGGGKDTLTGGLGNDTLVGGAGDDSLLGGDGNDVLNAGTATTGDVVDGGAGDDTLRLDGDFDDYVRSRPTATDTKLVRVSTGESITLRNVEAVSFDGDLKSMAEVNDNLVSAGNDTLTGTAGADSINGGAGVDEMRGLEGNDIYDVDVAGDKIVELDGGGADLVNVGFKAAGTYVLGDYVEYGVVTAAPTIAVSLTGNAQDNVLVGNAAANTLLGMAGDDTLDGGAGSDKLTGGAGDDVYVVDVAGDVVTELLDEGSDTVQTTLASYTLGTAVENLAYLGKAAFTGTGNTLANVIVGGVGNDNLKGLAGEDVFGAGGAGKDTIDGGADNDSLVDLDTFSKYTVTRPNGTDTVLTHISGAVITVRSVESFKFGNVTMTLEQVQQNSAGTTDDTLEGTSGNDTINGGSGADSMSGGEGDDTYVVDVAGDSVVELADEGNDTVQVGYAAAATYVLGTNVENATVTSTAAIRLDGNALDNRLTGNGAGNVLNGGGGDDTLIGGAGNDTMTGGADDDVYVVDATGDVVTEADLGGTDLVQTSLAGYTLGNFVEHLSYTGTAAFSGTGNALDNAITGNVGKDKLTGGAGNDTLDGGAGDDSLLGGDGNDVLRAGTGAADILDGGLGNDVVEVTGNFTSYARVVVSATDTRLTNTITGESFTIRGVESVQFADFTKSMADIIANAGTAASDTLTGTAGADNLNGGAGSDALNGLEGDDIYVVDVVGDVVTENADAGTDLVQVAYAAAGVYTLGANVENGAAMGTVAISLVGNLLDNELTGNGAANKLTGNAGNDTLNGGAGTDTLIGGAGDDVYVVDVTGDVVTEAVSEGTDLVQSAAATYTLSLNVENLAYTGTLAFTGTGNAGANSIKGGVGNDKLNGAAGNDTLTGGGGSDSLTGGAGDDVFVLDSVTGIDTISDFGNSVAKGFDKLAISQALATIGDGDLTIEGAELRATPGGFSADAELVIFSANTGGVTAATAATVIGSAAGNFTAGQQALFVVDNNSASYVYLFKSSGTDALVSAGELTQIAILTGNPATALTDYLFVS